MVWYLPTCGYTAPAAPLRLGEPGPRWRRCYDAARVCLSVSGIPPYWADQGATDWAEWMTFGVWRDRFLPSVGVARPRS